MKIILDSDKKEVNLAEVAVAQLTVVPSPVPKTNPNLPDVNSHSLSNVSILHLNLPKTDPSSQQELSLSSSMSLNLREVLRVTSVHNKDNSSKTLGLLQLPVPSHLTNIAKFGIDNFFYYNFFNVGKSCPHPKILSVILYPILVGILMVLS